MLLHSLVSHLVSYTLSQSHIGNKEVMAHNAQNMNNILMQCWAWLFLHIVSLLWNVLGSNITAECLTVLAFVFFLLYCILYSPCSCFISVCSWVQFTSLFLFFICSILTQDTPLPIFYSPHSIFGAFSDIFAILVLLWSDSQDICLHPYNEI